jgi:hypothetical protein
VPSGARPSPNAVMMAFGEIALTFGELSPALTTPLDAMRSFAVDSSTVGVNVATVVPSTHAAIVTVPGESPSVTSVLAESSPAVVALAGSILP